MEHNGTGPWMKHKISGGPRVSHYPKFYINWEKVGGILHLWPHCAQAIKSKKLSEKIACKARYHKIANSKAFPKKAMKEISIFIFARNLPTNIFTRWVYPIPPRAPYIVCLIHPSPRLSPVRSFKKVYHDYLNCWKVLFIHTRGLFFV